MPSEGRGRKTGNPVLRLPGRHGKKGCLAGNITMKSWRTEDDVPAAVASENGRVWLYSLAPKRDGKNTKKYGSRAVTKALGKMPAHPAEKRGLLFNFKMKEKWKVSINIKIVKSKICN